MSQRKRHTAKIKFQVVLETFHKDRNIAEVSRQYGVNPNLIHRWRKEFLERGQLVFETKRPEAEEKVEELENIIGKQTIEIQLLKKFLGHYSSP
jgi:putative transposase